MDKDLEAARRLAAISGYDPLDLPVFNVSCRNAIDGCFSVKEIQAISFSMYEGYFSNLATLRRDGDVEKVDFLKIPLKFDTLHVSGMSWLKCE